MPSQLPRILVVTSCTGVKRYKPQNPLTLEDFKNPGRLQQRTTELASFVCPAGRMYTGLQHLRLMEGVRHLRQSLGTGIVDLVILSAGYGLIGEDLPIAPYEVSFNTMKSQELDEWAKQLKIHQNFEQIIRDYELVFILLGEKYLRSLSLPVVTTPDRTLIFLSARSGFKYIRGLDAKILFLPLSNREAKRYGYGLVGLKGFLFKRFSESIAHKPEVLKKVNRFPEIFSQYFN